MGYTYNPSRRQCRHCMEVRQHGWPFSSSKMFATFPDHTEPLPRTRNLTVFYVLLTVHLSIFVLVINQLDVQHFLFNKKFISCLYMFRAHSSGGQNCITQPLVSSYLYVTVPRGTATFRYDDTRGCVMQF